MKEFLNMLLDKLSGTPLAVPVLLGLIGGGLLVVLFLFCLAISSACKIDKYRKLLIAGSRRLAESDPITGENADKVFDELQKHPESVRNGWSRFLEQRIGAPSDYFPARDVLSAPEFSGKRTAGKSLFAICGAIIWVLIGLIGYYYHTSYSTTAPDWSTAASIIMALEFLIIPVGIYIIGILTLDIVYGKKVRRLALSYMSFCETLDSKVAVEEREEDEFVQDNMAEINKRVEELVNGQLGDEIIEVVTVPKDTEPDMLDFESAEEIMKRYEVAEEPAAVEEEPIAEEPVEEEPAEEPVEEPAAAPIDPEKEAFVESVLQEEDFVRLAMDNKDLINEFMKALEDQAAATTEPEEQIAPDFNQMTQEESYEWLERVLQICDMALNDPKVDPGDLEEMGKLLEQALSGLNDPTCQAAITDYLGLLADKYYSIVEG